MKITKRLNTCRRILSNFGDYLDSLAIQKRLDGFDRLTDAVIKMEDNQKEVER